MSFSTLPFLFYFLPAFLAVYYIVPARFRNAVLALGSLLFYWLGAGTGALFVLLALILVNFAAGRLIEDAHGDERRAWLILALACDVGSLFYFKYMGWFLENLGRLTNTDSSFFRVALPLGVSFYVFQSIAYVADVYRGDAEAECSLLDYAAFQAMFPQLVMGPILRLRDVSAELHTKRPFSRAAVESGFSLFVVGLGCKVVLAGSENDDPEFTKLIEGCGAEVVCDRHCYGAVESRAPIVVKDGEKPLTAIARHYLETSNCPRFMPQDIMRERKQRLADLAKEYKADGIIVASNKFCEYWSYERTIDTIVMPRDFGYPVCSIEKEYINGASGQLRTRFQAFVESIEIKKIQEGK